VRFFHTGRVWRSTAHAQPRAQDRLQRKQADDQGEGKSKSCCEEVAHATTPMNREQSLLQAATERTVKVNQSRDLVSQGPCPSWGGLAGQKNITRLIAKRKKEPNSSRLLSHQPTGEQGERPYTEKGSARPKFTVTIVSVIKELATVLTLIQRPNRRPKKLDLLVERRLNSTE
jgi:hypothetical protein